MSFSIDVRVTDGTAEVTTSGDVPNGHFTISGHEDSGQRTLALSRRDADGRYVQNVSGVHYKDGA